MLDQNRISRDLVRFWKILKKLKEVSTKQTKFSTRFPNSVTTKFPVPRPNNTANPKQCDFKKNLQIESGCWKTQACSNTLKPFSPMTKLSIALNFIAYNQGWQLGHFGVKSFCSDVETIVFANKLSISVILYIPPMKTLKTYCSDFEEQQSFKPEWTINYFENSIAHMNHQQMKTSLL